MALLAILWLDAGKCSSSQSPPSGGLTCELRVELFFRNRPALDGGLFTLGHPVSEPLQSELLDFDKQGGLLTAVVQDASTLRVLMVGYMNREAFEKTVETGHVTFFSRSRQKLWTKGETSGHYLQLKSIRTDCDADALLVSAEPATPGVCHEGFESCFYRLLEDGRWIESEERVYDSDAVYGARQ